jgi:hypothetical protein
VEGGLGGSSDSMTLRRESGHKGGEAPERESGRRGSLPGYSMVGRECILSHCAIYQQRTRA